MEISYAGFSEMRMAVIHISHTVMQPDRSAFQFILAEYLADSHRARLQRDLNSYVVLHDLGI
jgi:hypothetical protein